MIPFQSTTFGYNLSISQGKMQNVWQIWKPVFGVLTLYNRIWDWILLLPYCAMMFLFLRKIPILSWEFFTAITITVVYGMIYGTSRHRDPAMIGIILLTGKYITYSIGRYR